MVKDAPSFSLSDTTSVPHLHFFEPEYDFGTAEQGEIVRHRFEFENIGTTEAVIYRTISNCDCTIATLSKERIEPGEKSFVDVEYNTTGRVGFSDRTFYIFANDKTWVHKLHLTGFVTAGSHPEIAKETNLQPFTGKCAPCHAPVETKGYLEARLYNIVCAMCHTPEKVKSRIGPSLEEMRKLDFDYIYDVTRDGIPGKSMWTFGEKQGGILSEYQVFTLAEYIKYGIKFEGR